MKRIVVASDSFKGCLTAREACDSIESGIRRVLSDTEIVKVPMADGGEGTVQSLVDATGGELAQEEVTDPLGGRIVATFGVLGGGETAVIEMAAASGLPLVPPDKRNPLVTTTRGTGELIRAAMRRGCRNLIIGIGGSATNDGGAGMAQALGIRLIDMQGRELGPGGGPLDGLGRINASALPGILSQIDSVVVACDVDNPLTGPRGASAVFGPQKGATPEMVKQLDRNLEHYASVMRRDLGKDVSDTPGAGAAGGLGAGLMAFLGAQLRSGVDIVIATCQLEEKLQGADLVITGEGKVDVQTIYGKTCIGVARMAKKHQVPVIAIGGTLGTDASVVLDHGIDALAPLTNGPMTLEEAMSNAATLLSDAAERVMRILQVGIIIRARRCSTPG